MWTRFSSALCFFIPSSLAHSPEMPISVLSSSIFEIQRTEIKSASALILSLCYDTKFCFSALLNEQAATHTQTHTPGRAHAHVYTQHTMTDSFERIT